MNNFGGILNTTDYEPFGRPLADAAPRQGYIGKEKDYESELADHGVRKLDYLTGRFMSVDPLWEKFRGWNGYHYSFNRPLNFQDANGLAPGEHVALFEEQLSYEGNTPSVEYKKQSEEKKAEHKENKTITPSFTFQASTNLTIGARIARDVKSVGIDANGGSIDIAGVQMGTDNNSLSYLLKDGQYTVSKGVSASLILGGAISDSKTIQNNEKQSLVGTESSWSFQNWGISNGAVGMALKMERTTYGDGVIRTFVGVDLGNSFGFISVLSSNLKVGVTFTEK